MRSSFLLLLSAAAYVAAAPHSYQDKVIRCAIDDNSTAVTLREYGVDVWSVTERTVDVHLSSTLDESIVYALIDQRYCSLFIDRLETLLQEERQSTLVKVYEFFSNLIDGTASDAFFDDYQSYAAIVDKLQAWTNANPTKVQFVPSIGKSFEGRDIPLVKITNFNSAAPKKAIWWNGGQHAREWISPATVMYQVNKLLTTDSPQVDAWLNAFEFYVTPIQNPDGYEFTRTPGNRLWRKNRRRNSDGSYGVDLNRNWDEHWGVVGTSKSPSSDVYQGEGPLSEPETKAIADYILSLPNKYAGIDFHSYSQLVLRSWGWTKTSSKNEAALKVLGDGMSAAIKNTSNVDYKSIKGAQLYPASGCMDDWMSAKAGMGGGGWTIELRDTGSYGFILPARFINPVGEEIWSAMNFFLNHLMQNPSIPPNEFVDIQPDNDTIPL